MKKWIITVVILIAAAAIFFAGKEREPDSVCALNVSCAELSKEPERISAEKRSLIPADGVVYQSAEAKFASGESAFEILQRELKKNKIHMEFSKSLGTAYVTAINNIYEKDAGELSGWLFKVNGEMANVGCDDYILKQGDSVEWYYSCDFTME